MADDERTVLDTKKPQRSPYQVMVARAARKRCDLYTLAHEIIHTGLGYLIEEIDTYRPLITAIMQNGWMPWTKPYRPTGYDYQEVHMRNMYHDILTFIRPKRIPR